MKRLIAIGIILLFIFCNISFTTLSNEYNGSLSGNITDKEMNPISGAKVTIECGEHYYECYSNDTGYYHQDNIPIVDCYWKVTVTKVGYKDDKIQIPIDENTIHNFILSPIYTIYVDDDNIEGPWDGSQEFPYKIIQNAIDNASDGDTVFVYNGIYFENLLVGKSINLQGEDKYSTIIDGGEKYDKYYAIYIYADFLEISGFTIENCKNGIVINKNSSIVISKNVIIDNRNGIFLEEANNNIITGNLIFNNEIGINLDNSRNNTIFDNTLKNNGIYIVGDSLLDYYNNIFNNSVNERDLIYLIGESGKKIENAGQVILVDCEKIIVENQNLSDSTFGLFLLYTNNCSIKNNTFVSNSDGGIYLGFSHYNNISENFFLDNAFGIAFLSSNFSTISNNNIFKNGLGCLSGFSNKNDILGNNFSSNYDGLWFLFSNDNLIQNIISNNTGYGIVTGISKGYINKIHQNNFIKNRDNALVLNIFFGSKYFFENREKLKNTFVGKYIEKYSLETRNKKLELIPRFSDWSDNYWDDWIGIGPKTIPGIMWIMLFDRIIPIPWLNIDWFPAKEPYKISIP